MSQNKIQTNRTVGSVRTNRNPNHATLKMLLIKPLSPLLNAYKNSLLKNDGKQEHFDVLYNYYDSYNLTTQMLTSLAIIEIRSTNIANPLFRGNTAFSKFYTQYVNTKCNDFISRTSQTMIKMLNDMKYDDKQVVSDMKYYQIVQKYLKLIDDSFESIPLELLWLLHHIYKEVENLRGVKDAIMSINTLFFMRYLYIPFGRMPNLFKYLQTQITPLLFVVPNCSKTYIHMSNKLNQIYQANSSTDDSNNMNTLTSLSELKTLQNDPKREEFKENNPEQVIVELIDFILNGISLIKPPKINQTRTSNNNSIDDQLLQIIQKNKESILELYEGDENDLTPLFIEEVEMNKTPRSRWN